MEMHDVIAEAIITILSERLEEELLRSAITKEVRKKLHRHITEEVFYKLLKEEKLNLYSGFGTVLVKKIREKEKKIYDKKTGTMVTKLVRGRKVAYRPGDLIKQLL
jgi:methyltransferase-like protein